MRDANIYFPLWQKYKPIIVGKMKFATETYQEYQLSKHEFEVIGDRPLSGYTFNLEISKGIVVNDIGGTAVARDLFEILKTSETAKTLMIKNYFKINLNKDFKLIIQTIVSE
jgi:hypothetical protein